MTMRAHTPPERAGWWQSGRWIPWTFVGGFGVVIAVNLTLVFFSLGSWTGLDTTNAYEKGLAYNDVLDAAAAQAQRGWDFALAYEDERIDVRMIGVDGAALDGLAVTARFVRPTHEGHDLEVPLRATGDPGAYGARVDLPYAGNWDVRLKVEGQGAPWFGSQRIWVR